jgi:hypothetical protein
MEVLREQWMWNREARSIWLWAFIASGVILAAVLYQFQGAMGLAAGFLPFLIRQSPAHVVGWTESQA